MLKILLFSYILIVPLTYGKTVKEKVETTDLKTPVLNKIQSNKTGIIAIEGGPVMSSSPALSLPEENQAIPITAANGISSNKVKARKGAVLTTEEDSESENLSVMKPNSPTTYSNQHADKDTLPNADMNNTNVFNKSNISSSETTVNKPHKPPILSADAIAKADKNNSNPALDDVNERKAKIDTMSSIGHPGMVMPIVITILVVPMFAVIGYMVLKRGQEAWKNRHYKRMDFLLDGMYND